MSLLGIIIAIIAVALLITGGLIEAVSFLLWVGIALAIIAAIAYLAVVALTNYSYYQTHRPVH